MSSARILVVDDSELFRKECIDMLRKSGEPWEVIEAPGGAEGIKAVSNRDVDIILLDINMPDIDGFRFLAIVEDKFPNIPVIVVTARRERKDITRCMELGAVDFIEKPFYQEDLVARVRARLRDKTRVDTLKTQVAVRRKKSRPSEGEAQ